MQNKKSLIIILIPVLVILILVAIKSCDKNNFRLDNQQVLKSSLSQKHILLLNQLQEKLRKSSNIVLIDLRNANDFKLAHLKNALNIPFSVILNNPAMEKLQSSEKELVLYSNSTVESTKAWTVLTQMGYKELFLLDIPGDLISEHILEKDTILDANETLKYKFQPGSLVGLE
jgi:rhodanese-related sulfurtransferase